MSSAICAALRLGLPPVDSFLPVATSDMPLISCPYISIFQASVARLSAAPQPQHQMQRGFLLHVVVSERAPVLQLLSRENQSLLVRGNAFLVLNFALHHVDRVRRLHFQRHSFASQRLDKDLHAHFLLNTSTEMMMILLLLLQKQSHIKVLSSHGFRKFRC